VLFSRHNKKSLAEILKVEVQEKLDKIEYKEKNEKFENEKKKKKTQLEQQYKAKENELNDILKEIESYKKEKEKLEKMLEKKVDLEQIYKLNDELFLIFGGMEGRLSKRNVCVYNTSKDEVTKIGKELMEQLRKQAKNSRKLTSLISSISKESLI
jgi:translation elongation factor EF-Tu-like GTPase